MKKEKGTVGEDYKRPQKGNALQNEIHKENAEIELIEKKQTPL